MLPQPETPCFEQVLTPGDHGENGRNGARAGVKGLKRLIIDLTMIPDHFRPSNLHSLGTSNRVSEAN